MFVYQRVNDQFSPRLMEELGFSRSKSLAQILCLAFVLLTWQPVAALVGPSGETMQQCFKEIRDWAWSAYCSWTCFAGKKKIDPRLIESTAWRFALVFLRLRRATSLHQRSGKKIGIAVSLVKRITVNNCKCSNPRNKHAMPMKFLISCHPTRSFGFCNRFIPRTDPASWMSTKRCLARISLARPSDPSAWWTL